MEGQMFDERALFLKAAIVAIPLTVIGSSIAARDAYSPEMNPSYAMQKAAGDLGEQAITNFVIASVQFYGLVFGAIIVWLLCVHRITSVVRSRSQSRLK